MAPKKRSKHSGSMCAVKTVSMTAAMTGSSLPPSVRPTWNRPANAASRVAVCSVDSRPTCSVSSTMSSASRHNA